MSAAFSTRRSIPARFPKPASISIACGHYSRPDLLGLQHHAPRLAPASPAITASETWREVLDRAELAAIPGGAPASQLGPGAGE